MRRISAALIVLLSLAAPGFAQDPLPERQLLNTRDVDFYGSDLQAIFDTTLENCQRACLNDAQCTAFTFNARSNSCFPKSQIQRQTAYEGAISGEVLTVPKARHDLARRRAGGELERLRDSDFDAARTQSQMLGAQTLAGSWDLETAREAYADRLSYGDKIGGPMIGSGGGAGPFGRARIVDRLCRGDPASL